jgi:hypothetical protein
MPEYIEIDGPDGPTVVELTDAALSTLGRADAIAAAAAAHIPTGAQRAPLPPKPKPSKER